MKVLHLPSSFLPESTGGKEVFVYQLIKNSPPTIEHLVVIHHGDEYRQYQYEGVNIQVLPATYSAKDYKNN